ncbi:alpha/beta fold hydrolase [Mesorhizobium australicum]|uniref:Pimeloyl-ACP methyl ester carboxylesterase n=1 Tax=Mesorhizobium australicum TaxID=536018 RepID=A0A1X7NKP5_9HYPH|nr:alpha/beta hydrolase [Mesorhizobium australicum]SMH38061.1 Pimeloyl-ACP methyl ester carboxylesterase [Mesorhizobium australicum]
MLGTPKWIEINGIRTRYFDKGAGEPIALITGGNFGSPSSASVVEIWHGNFEVLSRQYRVIAFDKLGQGHTDNPANDDYRMQAVVAHAASFLSALGLRGIHIVGQSRGAMLAARLTLECPELIRSCTLVNTGTLSPGVGLNEVELSGCPFPPVSRESQRWVFERCAYRPESIVEPLVEAGYEVLRLPKYQEAVMKMTRGGLAETLFLRQLAPLKRETLQWISDAGLGRPTQIIWGYNDHTTTLEAAVDLFQLISSRDAGASFHLINEAGHHPFHEHPAQFNAIMLEFLARLRR